MGQHRGWWGRADDFIGKRIGIKPEAAWLLWFVRHSSIGWENDDIVYQTGFSEPCGC
jgi:hypothetical protein